MVRKNRHVVYISLLLILVVAAFFRLWDLGNLPPGLYHDEAYNGLDALSLIDGKLFPQFYEGWELYAVDAHADHPPQQTRFPLFFEGNYGREPLHIYLMALSIAILDATPFAVRVVPAAAGILAVLTTFSAARVLFPDESYLLPLLAAFTLAVLYPAVHFSRFGIRAIVFVLVETLTVAFFWKGINHVGKTGETKKGYAAWLWFMAAGFFLGLSLYTFAAARLFPFLWILFVPMWFYLQRADFDRFWRYIIGMAAAATLTALPIMIFFLQYPYFFVFRIAYVANKGKGVVEGKPWLTWILNAGRVIRGLFFLGETHLRHNLPGRPYFDLIQAGFFLSGMLRAARSFLNPRYLFLLLWLGMMLMPSILSGDAPHFGRLSGAAAPAAILVALGAEWLVGKIKPLLQNHYFPELSGIITTSLIAGLFLVSALWTGVDYFFRFAKHPDLTADFYQDEWEMGLYAAGYSEEADIYLSPTQEELATILFALKDPDRLRNYNATGSLIPAGRPGNELLYLLKEDENAYLSKLQSFFADGYPGEAGEGFVSFYVPADAQRDPHNISTNIQFGEQIRLNSWSKRIEDNRLLVTLTWQAETEMDKDYTAFIHIIGEDGNLVSQLDRQPAGYPTSDWRPKEIVVDEYSLTLPEGFSMDDNIEIRTGFYFLPTMERLGEAAVLPG